MDIPLFVKVRNASRNFEPWRRALEGRDSASRDDGGVVRLFNVCFLGCCLSSGAPSSYMVKLGRLPVLLGVRCILKKVIKDCSLSAVRM